jgi:voltage-gated potassium channel
MGDSTDRGDRRGAGGSPADDRRRGVLRRWGAWLELPLIILGAAWLILLIVELTRGLTPVLNAAATAIWALFILDFLVRWMLSADKSAFLKKNWLMALSLAVPAIRVFQIFRILRGLRLAGAASGLRLSQLMASVGQNMRALGAGFGRRGAGYVAALTAVVLLAGAAGMYGFERGEAFDDYGGALWWTAMVMTTLGSEQWPRSGAGRALCLFLSLYAVAVFSYVTAAIASFFVDRDAQSDRSEVAGRRDLRDLGEDLRALRREVAALRDDREARDPAPAEDERPGD